MLVQLAVSMRAHGRGGIAAGGAGRQRRLARVDRPADSLRHHADVQRARRPRARAGRGAGTREWQDALDDTVDAIAGLTAVDGATIMTDRYELLAFGAKITRRDGSPAVEQVTVTEPIEGGETSIVHPSRLGGTRHLSAAQFVHDQQDAVALVASQDGRFTVFAWSPCENMVHAHRVETLLL